MQVPAHIRGLSCSPLLERLDLRRAFPGIQWVFVGGETGSEARPCSLAWIRSIRDQCRAAG
ncbi:MAG: phage Gp37/Gp68 family protein, partial [Nitrospiraceae bacterium]